MLVGCDAANEYTSALMVDVFGMRCSVMVSSIAQTAVITKDDILCGKPTIQLHVCMLGLVFFILKHTKYTPSKGKM